MANNSRVNITLGFNADTDQAKRQINDLVNQLRSIQSTPTTLVDDTSLRKASAAAAELQGHLQKAVDVNTGKLDLSRFSASLKQSGKQLSDYRRDLEAIGPVGSQAFLSVAKSIATAETPLLRTNKRLNEFMTTMKNTAKWQISSSIMHGFMGAVQQAYGYSQSLNESLNNIRIVTGYNTEQMAEFASQANKAAKALSTTTTDYTNASLIYFQQGLSDEEVQKRTDITVKMANVARDSVDNVSNQLTAIWNNFYEEGGKSLEYYADVMTALGAKTASSTEEIAGGLEKFAAIGDTIGLSYEYAASALATITSNTRQSEEVVGTALKTIFARIQGLNLGETLEDGTSLNKYSEALAKVGVSIFEQNGELKAMDNILDELAARWDTLNSAQQTSLAQTVAGVRQYTQLIALMENWNNGDEDSFMANINTSRNAEGALNEQADIYADSWEAARDRVKAAQEDIYDSLINDEFFIQLDDILTPVLSGVADVVDSFGGLGGVIGFVGSLFLRYFSKQIPGVLKELKQNLMVVTGQANKIAIAEQQKNIQNISTAQSMTKYGSSTWTDLEVTKKINEMQIKLNANAKQLSDEEREAYELKIQQVQAIGDILVAQAKEIDNLEEITKQQDNAAKHVVRRSGVEANRKQNNDLSAEQESKISEINSIQKKVDAAKLAVSQLAKTQKELDKKPNSWKQIKTNADEIEKVTSELTDQKKILDDLLKQLKKAQQELSDIDVKITDKIDFREDYQQEYNDIIAQADAIGQVQGAMELAENQAKAWQSAMPTSEEDIAKVRKTAKALKDSLVGKDKAFSDDNEFWNALAGGKQINFDTDSIEDIIKLFTQVSQKAADADAHIQKMEDTLTEDIDKLQEKVPDTENRIRKAADAHIEHSQAVTVNANAHKNFNDANIELDKHLNSISEIMGKTVAGIMSGASAANTINNAFRTWGDETTTLGEKLMDVVTIATSLSTSIVPAVTSIKSIATETKKAGGTWKDTMQNILKSGDIWLAAAQLVVVGISLVVDSFERAKKESKELAEQTSKDTAKMREANEAAREQVKVYDELLKRYKAGEDVQEDLNKTLEDLIKTYGDEVSSLAILTGNYEDYYEVLSKIHKLEQERAGKEIGQYEIEYANNIKALQDNQRTGGLFKKKDGLIQFQDENDFTIYKADNDNFEQQNYALQELIKIFQANGLNVHRSHTQDSEGLVFYGMQDTEETALSLYKALEEFSNTGLLSLLSSDAYSNIIEYFSNVSTYGAAALSAKENKANAELQAGKIEGFDNEGYQTVSTFSDYAKLRKENYDIFTQRTEGDTDQAIFYYSKYIANSTNSSLVQFESQYRQLESAAKTMQNVTMDELLRFFEGLSNTQKQMFFTGGLDIGEATDLSDLRWQIGEKIAGSKQAATQQQAEIAKQIADWASSDDVEDFRNIFDNETFDWERFKTAIGKSELSTDELKTQIVEGALGDLDQIMADYIQLLDESQKESGRQEIANIKHNVDVAEGEYEVAKKAVEDYEGDETSDEYSQLVATKDAAKEKYDQAVARLEGLEANIIINTKLNQQNIEALKGEAEEAINPVELVPELKNTTDLEKQIEWYENKLAEFDAKGYDNLSDANKKLYDSYSDILNVGDQNNKGLYAQLQETTQNNLTSIKKSLRDFANGTKEEGKYVSIAFASLSEEAQKAIEGLGVEILEDKTTGLLTNLDNFENEIQEKISSLKTKIADNNFVEGETKESLEDSITMWETILSVFTAFVSQYRGAADAAASALKSQGEYIASALEHTDAKASYNVTAQIDNTISYLQSRIKELEDDGSTVAIAQIQQLSDELNYALEQKQTILNNQRDALKSSLINQAKLTGLGQILEDSSFDADGNIIGEASIVDAIQNRIDQKEKNYNPKSEKEEEQFKNDIEALEKLIDLINDYNGALGDSRDILEDINDQKKYKGDDYTLKNSIREHDIYQEINKELDEVEDSLADINRIKNKAYGKDYIKALQDENKQLEVQRQRLQEKKKIAQEQLEIDKLDVRMAVLKYQADLQDKAVFDQQTGALLNYSEVVSFIYNQIEAAQAQWLRNVENGLQHLNNDIDRTIQKWTEMLNTIQGARQKQLDTESLIREIDNSYEEAWDQILSNNSEMWRHKIEVELQIDENELEILDKKLSILGDGFYSMAEAAGLMMDKVNKIGSQEALDDIAGNWQELQSLFSSNSITQKDFVDNAQMLFDQVSGNIDKLMDIDKEMMEYYSKAIDAAGEEMDYYTSQLEHFSSVLDHYRNIVEIVNGEMDYERTGAILEGRVKTLQNEMKVSEDYYAMLKREQDAAKAALASATGEKEKELLEANLKAITEAVIEAEEEMLSKTEEWAEATKELMENTMAKAARAMEMAFTDGLTFDFLSDSMDRLSTYQDEYLTKTNQMYETEKLMRTAQQAADKTQNKVAKEKLQGYIRETTELQNKNKLSKLELEIQQAKYDILVAEIALEEAQNAKSTVRLQRDSEGNFGYVYTADSDKIMSAEQDLADASNRLHNIQLDAFNENGQKLIESAQQYADALIEIEERRVNGEFKTDEDYMKAKDQLQKEYNDLFTIYSHNYTVAMKDNANIQQEAWVSSYQNIIDKTYVWSEDSNAAFDTVGQGIGEWKNIVDGYLGECETAYSDWRAVVETESEVVQQLLTDTQGAVDEVTKSSDELATEVTTVVIPGIEAELSAVREITTAYGTMRDEVYTLADAYVKLLGDIEAAISAAAGMSDITIPEVKFDDGGLPPKVPGDEEDDVKNTNLGGGGKLSHSSMVDLIVDIARDGDYGVLGGDPDRKGTIDSAYLASKVPADYATAQAIVNQVTKTDPNAAYAYAHGVDKSGKTWIEYVEEAVSAAGFNTGGYTGSWGPEGRLAFLHEKELILKPEDTQNFLAATGLLRDIAGMIDLQAMYNQMTSPTASTVSSGGGFLEQAVHIEASFPAVQDRNEIQEAFNNLLNTASQYANRK